MRTNQAMLYSMKWCRKFLEVTNACVSIAYLFAKATFKKYSIVKITGNGHRKGADPRVKVFLTRWARLNLHTPA